MGVPESDERVMRCLGRGQDAALGELMSRWQAPLWCFIDRMAAGLGATDDMYQEVWTRVFLYRRRYRPEMPFRPYLFTIAVNCCRRALRHRRRPGEGLARLEDAPPAADPDPAPLDKLIAAERHGRLHRAIRRLPQMQRSVVLLYLLFDSDYAEIARVLGRRRGTVRSHMHHALIALRRTLTRISVPAEGKVDHERQVH